MPSGPSTRTGPLLPVEHHVVGDQAQAAANLAEAQARLRRHRRRLLGRLVDAAEDALRPSHRRRPRPVDPLGEVVYVPVLQVRLGPSRPSAPPPANPWAQLRIGAIRLEAQLGVVEADAVTVGQTATAHDDATGTAIDAAVTSRRTRTETDHRLGLNTFRRVTSSQPQAESTIDPTLPRPRPPPHRSRATQHDGPVLVVPSPPSPTAPTAGPGVQRPNGESILDQRRPEHRRLRRYRPDRRLPPKATRSSSADDRARRAAALAAWPARTVDALHPTEPHRRRPASSWPSAARRGSGQIDAPEPARPPRHPDREAAYQFDGVTVRRPSTEQERCAGPGPPRHRLRVPELPPAQTPHRPPRTSPCPSSTRRLRRWPPRPGRSDALKPGWHAPGHLADARPAVLSGERASGWPSLRAIVQSADGAALR